MKLLRLLLIVLISGFCGSCDQSHDLPVQPNVVLVLLNNIGSKDIAYPSGNFFTPNINKIAEQSVVFSNAYSLTSEGNSSMVGIFTGRYPFKHGIYGDDHGHSLTNEYQKLLTRKQRSSVIPDSTTLPKVLKKNGYATYHVGRWGISEDINGFGFDDSEGGYSKQHIETYTSPYNIPGLTNGKAGEHLTDRLTNEAIGYMESAKKPFFLSLAYYAAGPPFKSGNSSIKQEYSASVERLDNNIGILFNYISTSKQLQSNTIVIITSVNGAINSISSQKPYRGGKGSYYQGGIRVPLIAYNPFVVAKTINLPVSTLDIYPTITDICGVYLTEHQDGVNLSNAIKGGKSNVHRNLYWHFPVYTPAYHPDKDMGSDRYFRTRPGSAIISDNYKLIEYFEDNRVELYHLTSDPGESNNIADMHHEIVSKLLKDLREWRELHNAYVPQHINPSYKTLISIR